MKNDYTWKGTKGQYWIHFEKRSDGNGVLAQATEPIPAAGGAVGPIARKSADTEEEAERLLLTELERLDRA